MDDIKTCAYCAPDGTYNDRICPYCDGTHIQPIDYLERVLYNTLIECNKALYEAMMIAPISHLPNLAVGAFQDSSYAIDLYSKIKKGGN